MKNKHSDSFFSEPERAAAGAEELIKSLHESEEQFRAIFELASIGIVQADPQTGRWLRVNGKFCEITGYAASELLSMHICEITHPDDWPQDWASFQRVARGEDTHYRNETRYIRKDGTVVWVSVNVTVLPNEAGQPWRSIATIEDITERKQAEEALRLSEAKFSTAFQTVPVLMGIARLSDGLIFDVNQAFIEATGFSREELIGKTNTSLNLWADPAERGRMIEELRRMGVVTQREMVLRRKDGQHLDGLYSVCRLLIGQVECTLFIMTDITERKRAEDAIRRSEARFADAERVAHLGAWELDMRTLRLYWSDEVYRIFGYSPEEFGATEEAFLKTVHPEDLGRVRDTADKALRGVKPFFVEHRIIRPDGLIRVVQEKAEVSRDEAGNPVRMLGIVLDITERKEAEAEMRLSEERYHQLFDTVIDAVSIFDAQTHCCLDTNPSAIHMYGYTREEMLGMKYDELTAQLGLSRESVAATLNGERQFVPLRYHLKKDGTVFPVEICSTTFWWRERQVICGVVRDITERMRAEEALRQSEEKYRTLVESAGETIATVDQDGRFLFMNSTAARELGGRPEDFVGQTMWDLFPPQIADRQAASVRRVISNGQGEAADSLVLIQGRSHWYHTSVAPLRNSQGRVIAALVVARDITDRKLAEEEISRLAAIVASSNDAIFSMTLEGVFTSWNAGAERLFNYSATEVLGKSKVELTAIERWEEVGRIMDGIRRGEPIEPQETVWQRKGGQRIHVSLTGSPIRNKAGDLVGVSMIAADITERVALKQAVLEVTSREHRRIGQELHDSVGQNLTGLGFMTRSLVQTLEGQDLPEARLATRIAEGIEQALGEIRAVARGLIPVEVDADGLRSALGELALVTSMRYGISCMLRCDTAIAITDNDVATHVYRIAQEAITNAIKHGKAQHIQLILGGAPFTLQIIDDGAGMPKTRKPGKGTGLQIMHYRASLTGGRLTVGPAPGGGTQVTLTLQQAARTEGGHHEPAGEKNSPHSDRG